MAGEGSAGRPSAPLSGRTIIVTRAREQAGGLRESLERLGARVILSPAIRFAEPADWGPVDRALSDAGRYDWAIFTSVNGVAAVDRRLAHLGASWSRFEGVRIVAIGPQTAEDLQSRGLAVDRMPDAYQAEGILASLEDVPLAGKKVLLARAEKAREVLPEELRARDAEVDVVPVYRTLPAAPDPGAVEALRRSPGKAVVVMFTSSSTVEHFLSQLPDDAREGLRRATLAAIGPITAGTLRRFGLAPDVQPDRYTVPALLESLVSHFHPGPAAS